MFDTNINEAILHNDFLVDFFQQKTTSPTFTLTQSNSEFTPKKLGLKWPKKEISSYPNHWRSQGRWGTRC